VFGIVLLGQVWRDLEHLERDDVEPFVLKSPDHLTHEAALHAVRLE